MFVKPGLRQDADDLPLVVRAPNGWLLPADGADVPNSQFWTRRLRDGDVVTVEGPAT
jgi:hypothetical protein